MNDDGMKSRRRALPNTPRDSHRAARETSPPVLVQRGQLTADQARSHPHRNVVTQALGVTDPQQLNVETLTGELRPGMQLLLCSDGLTEEVDDRSIAKVLAHQECSAQECVDGLVAAALDGGGSDNVTVVLVRRH